MSSALVLGIRLLLSRTQMEVETNPCALSIYTQCLNPQGFVASDHSRIYRQARLAGPHLNDYSKMASGDHKVCTAVAVVSQLSQTRPLSRPWARAEATVGLSNLVTRWYTPGHFPFGPPWPTILEFEVLSKKKHKATETDTSLQKTDNLFSLDC